VRPAIARSGRATDLNKISPAIEDLEVSAIQDMLCIILHSLLADSCLLSVFDFLHFLLPDSEGSVAHHILWGVQYQPLTPSAQGV
jgi:hypothetical protein